jgi:hypothetical protein
MNIVLRNVGYLERHFNAHKFMLQGMKRCLRDMQSASEKIRRKKLTRDFILQVYAAVVVDVLHRAARKSENLEIDVANAMRKILGRRLAYR